MFGYEFEMRASAQEADELLDDLMTGSDIEWQDCECRPVPLDWSMRFWEHFFVTQSRFPRI